MIATTQERLARFAELAARVSTQTGQTHRVFVVMPQGGDGFGEPAAPAASCSNVIHDRQRVDTLDYLKAQGGGVARLHVGVVRVGDGVRAEKYPP